MAKTITWDGVKDGRDTIVTEGVFSYLTSFYKVSNEVFKKQDFDGATFVYANGTEDVVSSFKDCGGGVVVADNRIISGYAGTYYEGGDIYSYLTLPTDGTYFAYVIAFPNNYIASATFPNVEDTTVPSITARDLYRKINGKPTKLTLYKKLGGKLVALDEHTKGGKT